MWANQLYKRYAFLLSPIPILCEDMDCLRVFKFLGNHICTPCLDTQSSRILGVQIANLWRTGVSLLTEGPFSFSVGRRPCRGFWRLLSQIISKVRLARIGFSAWKMHACPHENGVMIHMQSIPSQQLRMTGEIIFRMLGKDLLHVGT